MAFINEREWVCTCGKNYRSVTRALCPECALEGARETYNHLLNLMVGNSNKAYTADELKTKEGVPPAPMVGIGKWRPKEGGFMEAAKATTCGLCSREILTPSGKDADGKDLCGECAEARKAVVQRTCSHTMKRGLTCVDCGKRCLSARALYVIPWTGLKWLGGWVVRLFVMYTVPAMASSAITAFALWFLARKFGLI